MSIAERIREARRDKGLSQSDLAYRIRVSRGACGQWERGESTPSVQNLALLAAILDIRFEWLATGRGEKQYDLAVRDESPPHYMLEGTGIPLDDNEKELLEAFSKLSEEGRLKLIEFLKTIRPTAA